MEYDITKDIDKRPPTLEIIKWLDHSSFTQSLWRDYDDYVQMDNYPVFSVGWVIKEDKEAVILLASVARENGKGFNDVRIVKTAILERWKLGDPSTPKHRRRVAQK